MGCQCTVTAEYCLLATLQVHLLAASSRTVLCCRGWLQQLQLQLQL